MASKIEVIIQHALRTFSKGLKKIPECSSTELNELKVLTDNITAKDVKKLSGVLSSSELKEFLQQKKTALDYLPVYEDDDISVGVFLLRQGAKLPIHDHPDMYGIIKVLEGILKITSYTFIELDTINVINDKSMFFNHPLKVAKYPEVIVSNKDPSCLLTPSNKNIHEVECLEGPAAFLDILSPPYEEGSSNQPRVCHFFEEIAADIEAKEGHESEKGDSTVHVKLKQVPSPF